MEMPATPDHLERARQFINTINAKRDALKEKYGFRVKAVNLTEGLLNPGFINLIKALDPEEDVESKAENVEAGSTIYTYVMVTITKGYGNIDQNKLDGLIEELNNEFNNIEPINETNHIILDPQGEISDVIEVLFKFSNKSNPSKPIFNIN